MLRWICERFAHPAPYAIMCMHVDMRFQSLGVIPTGNGLSIRNSRHSFARLSLVMVVLGSGFVAADASEGLSRREAVIDGCRTKPHLKSPHRDQIVTRVSASLKTHEYPARNKNHDTRTVLHG